MKKKIDINSEEIARLAGVSRSTVSRVINHYPNVPQKTKEKVMKVIKEYNYYPNLSAQVLAGKKTKTLGLFIIERGHLSEDTSVNEVITCLIEHASLYGFYVLAHVIRDTTDPENVHNVKEFFYQGRIDGGIFIGAANHEPLVEELIAEGFIVGIVDQVLPGRNESNRIVCNFNNEGAIMQAVDYFVSMGHKRIGIITSDLKKSSTTSKLNGFMAAMEKHGLSINDRWILPGFYEGGGYTAIEHLVRKSKDLPTAIFASNDNIAFAAIRALNDFSLRVPEDISIIGMNDQKLSAYYKPALTTFRANFREMMLLVTKMVVESILEGAGEESLKVTMDMQFIERESVARIN
ncbi:LacI family DNA-binding transcriptional regulator [Ammoniphilus sp. YIM 78166]|uniref:LacI family DNA-binding transcriptional regulator n=1 Tax=Ammoniphilus sp. YIM 78166 TaxID=1644106 RepID=UPI00106FFD98|nr:LacI family DNA-binding transcriptional regulator [Ammoniphilus sp. YIM 78166]